MTVQNEILDAVIDMAQATNPYADITIGALPVKNGISMAYATGAPESTFWTKGMPYQMSVVLNGKHSNAQTVSDALNAIHLALTQTKTYPQTSKYQITNISTISTPSYLGREEENQILYGSSLRVSVFIYDKEREID